MIASAPAVPPTVGDLQREAQRAVDELRDLEGRLAAAKAREKDLDDQARRLDPDTDVRRFEQLRADRAALRDRVGVLEARRRDLEAAAGAAARRARAAQLDAEETAIAEIGDRIRALDARISGAFLGAAAAARPLLDELHRLVDEASRRHRELARERGVACGVVRETFGVSWAYVPAKTHNLIAAAAERIRIA